jgi:hypothetical protein
VSDPATLTRVAYGLVPRDILIGIEQRLPGNIGQDDWAALTKLAAVMKEIAPGASLDEIEAVLRSGFAKTIEG